MWERDLLRNDSHETTQINPFSFIRLAENNRGEAFAKTSFNSEENLLSHMKIMNKDVTG
jgi:hypothetical protein